MTAYSVAPRANKEILEIWLRIARENELAADNLQAAIYDSFEEVARFPGIGHQRTDLIKPQISIWTIPFFKNYQVVYVVRLDGVRILRVLHGARWKVWKQL